MRCRLAGRRVLFALDDVAIAELVNEADALVTAVRRTVNAEPAIGEVLARELRKVEQHELAGVIVNIAVRAEQAQRVQMAIEPTDPRV